MFRQIIDKRRKQLKWTIIDLARSAGVDRSRLSKWLNKKVKTLKGETIEKLLRAMKFKSITFTGNKTPAQGPKKKGNQ